MDTNNYTMRHDIEKYMHIYKDITTDAQTFIGTQIYIFASTYKEI